MRFLVEGLVACPICSGELGEQVAKLNDELVYYACRDCGAHILSPRMTDEMTREYYAKFYRHLVPISDRTKMSHLYRALDQIRLVAPLLTGKTALELGSSSGYLVQELVKRGFNCQGVDPDPQFGWAKSIEDVEPLAYDLICLSHTLEHFNHPREELKNLIDRFSHPGTRFLIEVPDPSVAPLHMAYRIHHPIAWTEPALRRLFDLVGLRVIFSTHHGVEAEAFGNLLMVGER